MRRYMIERISLHVGELPVELNSNCCAKCERRPRSPYGGLPRTNPTQT